MSRPIAKSLLGSVAVLALVAPALAQPDASDPLAAPGWRPWLSVGFDIQSQDAEARFASDSVPLLAGGTRPSSASDSENVIVPLVSLEAALEAPAFLGALGGPRAFVHVGGQIPTKPTSVIFREQGPDGDPALGRSAEHLYELEIVGSWYAGLGLAWTWPIAGRHLSIRPSIDYYGERVRFQGSTALGERDPATTPPGGETPLFETDASVATTYHALGPRLAADVLLGRRGRVGFALYSQTQFYWILSEREQSLVAEESASASPGSRGRCAGQRRARRGGRATGPCSRARAAG
jgi:hypothetical protein